MDPATREFHCARSRERLRKLQAKLDDLHRRIRLAVEIGRTERVPGLRFDAGEIERAIELEERNYTLDVCAPPATGTPGGSGAPDGTGVPGGPPTLGDDVVVVPSADFTFPGGKSADDPAETGSITFDGSGSSDTDGTIVKWEWKVAGGSYVDRGPRWTQHMSAGRSLVFLKVTDDDGAWAVVAKEIFVRGPGQKRVTLDTPPLIECPDAAHSPGTVTVSVRVPSWAREPYTAALEIPEGQCPGATFSQPTFKEINFGNDIGETDDWGRQRNTVTFEFTISGDSSGTTTPTLVASWQ